MDMTQESAIQYAQRLGLFHDHRHSQFSLQSCLASIQTIFEDPLEQLVGNESLSNEIDLPNGDMIFEQESLAERVPDELGCTAQTRLTFSSQPSSLNDLLLELPDIGPSSSTDSDAFSHIIGFMPKNCLVSQYLPLISVDQSEDQGLNFPPHIDRLHQALLYKLDVLNSAVGTGPLKIKPMADSEVFSVQEDAITPPQSPEFNHQPTADNSKLLSLAKEKRLRATTPSPRVAKLHRTSQACYRDRHKQQALQRDPDEAAPSTSVPETRLIQQIEDFQVKESSQEGGVYPLEVKSPGDPFHAFFEDALFSSDEKDADIEIESMASNLDQIDNILLPLPNISTSELSHLRASNATLPATPEWASYKHLPPLLVDSVLEEALQWAPLPPRRGGPFEAEPIMELNKQSATKMQEVHHIGTLGTLEDGEIEECSRVKKVINPLPTPPSNNSLDSLIKLRLQRSASERVQPSPYGDLSSHFRLNKSILPSADDPGATSKLVSAFMSLRGVQPARSKLK